MLGIMFKIFRVQQKDDPSKILFCKRIIRHTHQMSVDTTTITYEGYMVSDTYDFDKHMYYDKDKLPELFNVLESERTIPYGGLR